jgi:hypothetical protein
MLRLGGGGKSWKKGAGSIYIYMYISNGVQYIQTVTSSVKRSRSSVLMRVRDDESERPGVLSGVIWALLTELSTSNCCEETTGKSN